MKKRRLANKLLVVLSVSFGTFFLHSLVGAEKASACAFGTATYLSAENARLETYGGSPWIWTTGSIQQWPDWYCAVDLSFIQSQTKSCGIWGCNWQTRNQVSRSPNLLYWIETPGFQCRSGTNRYRGRVEFNYRQLDYVDWFLVFVPGAPQVHSSPIEYEFSCK